MIVEKDSADIAIWMAPILKALGVYSITASLSGSGDSGGIDDVTFIGEDEKELPYVQVEAALGNLTLDNGSPLRRSFMDLLNDKIERDADSYGNYCDNEGGSVWLKYDIDPEDGLTITEGDYQEGEYEDDPDDPDDYGLMDGPGEDEDMEP